ncbi:MAG: cytochrome c/FTR1 family iron permease [Gammaproteobacteria bacterium]|nr:MAG: cytochrome c/FTR1 family iron permease [Gammaproteobacteria bacterium]
MRVSAFLFLFLMFFARPSLAGTQQLLQLIDYVGVDYSGAVIDGQVANKAEYDEMLDFTAGISQQLADLPEHNIKAELLKDIQTLSLWVQQKESAEKIRQLTAQMHHKIINAYQIMVVPRTQPDMEKAEQLYAEQCASCHGVEGFGDGPAAIGMEPSPINFHDIERYQQRTIYGLHSTITQGVNGTAMRAYDQLSDDERWALAFYVGSIAVEAADIEADDIKTSNTPLLNISKLTVTTPAQAEQQYGDEGAKVMAYLRHHPEMFYNNESNLAFARQRLGDVLTAYKNNEHKKAYQYAVEAYLEGFELVEQNINAFDKPLKLEIEIAMTELRNKIRSGESITTIENDIAFINEKIAIADELLGSTSLSGGAAYASAFFILLREGLEALLIVAALAAFLVRTKRQDGLLYIHLGWISALVLGLFTWWASISLVSISGASREITEGVAAIVATLVLLYVGFWMHDKTSAAKWKKFIDDSMHKALTSGTLWTLTGLSFIAVYREAFETILFYQALWAQTSEAGKTMAFSGFLSAIAALAVLGWLIMRYSVRLPLRQFFAVTGGLMFVLAIIFAGKGIAALQEAGVIISSPVNFFRIDLLGIYPSLQGLLVQFGLIILAVILWNKKSSKILR